jgi:hypothetical protein
VERRLLCRRDASRHENCSKERAGYNHRCLPTVN